MNEGAPRAAVARRAAQSMGVCSAMPENTVSLEREPETGYMAGAAPFDLIPDKARGVVLFIHGYGGTPNNFHTLPTRVAGEGWRARSIMLPGHGTLPSAMRGVTAGSMLDAVAQEIQTLRKAHERIILLGHSMGGAIATVSAAKHPVDGLILAAPYFKMAYRPYYMLSPETWASLLTPLLHWAPLLGQPVKLKTSRPKIVSYRWSHRDAMRAAIALGKRARAPEVLDAISCPVLLLHGALDGVTSLAAAEEAVAAMPAQRKQTVVLERSDHVIFWDYDAEAVEDVVAGFLAASP